MSIKGSPIHQYPNGMFYVSTGPLELYFKADGFGASRILPPKELHGQELFFTTEEIVHVDCLFRQYAESIRKIGERFNWRCEEKDPFSLSSKFADWLVRNKIHEKKELDLSNLKLTIIPPHISLFKNLEKLDLSRNSLYTLWPEITSSKLTELNLSGNPIAKDPPKLKNCTIINLSSNQLKRGYPHISK